MESHDQKRRTSAGKTNPITQGTRKHIKEDGSTISQEEATRPH
jgi:hypothetical protein